MEKHEIREEFREDGTYAWALKSGAGFLQEQMEGNNCLDRSNNMQTIGKSVYFFFFAESDFGAHSHGCCELLCYLSSCF